jgi:glycogen debranching enzyme
LWLFPRLARDVLLSLAALQASRAETESDAEPGKILHEARDGEMALTGETVLHRYYGSADATPLFVVLAGKYIRRTGDMDALKVIWPHVERALRWIDRYGDLDRDGFQEYIRRSPRGIRNQVWKDSEDSMFHADGTLAEPPVSALELQGYVFEAKIEAAFLAKLLGHDRRHRKLLREAALLRESFHRSFWQPDLGLYALGLDGQKRALKVRASNSGLALFSGIAESAAARRIHNNLMDKSFFNGWGIRTIAEGEPRYNPMSYHNGSVWPHDCALIAAGFARYGFHDTVLQILDGLFALALSVGDFRLPELVCGFERQEGLAPVRYPVACSPQAWAAGAVFLMIQSILGLSFDANMNKVQLLKPRLPDFISWLTISKLRIRDGQVTLNLHRTKEGVSVDFERPTGADATCEVIL